MRTAILTAIIALVLAGCGPFRPPEYESVVAVKKVGDKCAFLINGTWPNLPHNPIQWFVGGRSPFLLELRLPGRTGLFTWEKIDAYWSWTNSQAAPHVWRSLGSVQADSTRLNVKLTILHNNKQVDFSGNGEYSLRDDDDCT